MRKITNKPNTKIIDNEKEYLILNDEYESSIDSKISEIEKFMDDNSGKGKSNEEKDSLYKQGQEKWKEYAKLLREIKYNFYLNRIEFKFLTDLLSNKLEYDVNTVFFAIELAEMIKNMKIAKWLNDEELISFEVNATEITYIYHLISTHKVKGLSKDSYTFSKILLKIGDISKIFNYYDNYSKDLSANIQDWVAAFEDGVEIEKREE